MKYCILNSQSVQALQEISRYSHGCGHQDQMQKLFPVLKYSRKCIF